MVRGRLFVQSGGSTQSILIGARGETTECSGASTGPMGSVTAAAGSALSRRLNRSTIVITAMSSVPPPRYGQNGRAAATSEVGPAAFGWPPPPVPEPSAPAAAPPDTESPAGTCPGTAPWRPPPAPPGPPFWPG